MFWNAIFVATAGNTLGGALDWWMGYGAERAYERVTHHSGELRAVAWLRRFGAKACLLSWLPVVGDPLCAVAGWLKLPFWPCVFYMGLGKLAQMSLAQSQLNMRFDTLGQDLQCSRIAAQGAVGSF